MIYSTVYFITVIAIAVFAGVSLPMNRCLLSEGIRLIGGAIFLVGFVMRLFAWYSTGIYEMKDIPPKKPYGGIYNYIRNPKIWGSQIMFWGSSIVLTSMVGVILSTVILLPMHIYRAREYNNMVSQKKLKHSVGVTNRV